MIDLEDTQRQDIEHITSELSEHSGVLFCAPTGYGKTRVSLGVWQRLRTNRLTVSLSSYHNINTFISELKKLNEFKNCSVCIVKGRGKTAKEVCKSTCTNCPYKRRGQPEKIEIAKGEVFDAHRAKQLYPDKCPYVITRSAARNADIIITHHRVIETNTNGLPTDGLLIVDEADRALEPVNFELSYYTLANWHLQRSDKKTDLQYLHEIINKLKSKNPYSSDIAEQSYEERVKSLSWVVDEEFKKAYEKLPQFYEMAHIAKKINKLKKLPEKDIKVSLLIGIQNAYEELTGNKIIPKLVADGEFADLAESFTDWDLKRLKNEERELIKRFLYLLKTRATIEPKVVKSSELLNGNGYVEIMMKGQTQFYRRATEFDKVLFMTATPLLTPEDIPIVKAEYDPYGRYKTFIKAPLDKVIKDSRRLLNWLCITTSSRRAEEYKAKYGGVIIDKDIKLHEAVERARTEKGLLLWIFYGSKSERGTNDLSILDGVLIFDMYDRSDRQYLKTEYKENCKNELYQITSRVLRGAKRKVAVAEDDEILNALKERSYKGWKFIEKDKVNFMDITMHMDVTPAAPAQKRKKIRLTDIEKTAKFTKEHILLALTAQDGEINKLSKNKKVRILIPEIIIEELEE